MSARLVAAKRSRRSGTVLAVAGLMLALFLVSLDQTIVGTALPKIVADFNGFQKYSWVPTAYLLASTATIPIMGKLGDIYGRKWFIVSGIVVFLIGSALCGAAWGMGELIVFRGIQGLGAGMIERGRGSIVTMASSAGRLPSQASAAYAAAKAGVVMFSRHVANEVGQHGVRVNCLAPSSVLTERVERLMPEETQRQVAAMHPLGRMGTPEDVALATLFLASESSSWITGVTLDVAGGRIMV